MICHRETDRSRARNYHNDVDEDDESAVSISRLRQFTRSEKVEGRSDTKRTPMTRAQYHH